MKFIFQGNSGIFLRCVVLHCLSWADAFCNSFGRNLAHVPDVFVSSDIQCSYLERSCSEQNQNLSVNHTGLLDTLNGLGFQVKRI